MVQAQATGDFSQGLSARCEESAEKAAFAESGFRNWHPCLTSRIPANCDPGHRTPSLN